MFLSYWMLYMTQDKYNLQIQSLTGGKNYFFSMKPNWAFVQIQV